jgi:DNA-binding MarR family transcriptional regulator
MAGGVAIRPWYPLNYMESHGSGRTTPKVDGRREVLDALRRLVRALRVSAREAERRTGLSMAQLFVLQRLGEAPALSIRELAKRTFTDPSSVSVVVSRAVRTGLVGRARDPRDGRRARLSLTRRGRSLLEKAPRSGQEGLIGALERMPVAARRQLGRLLAELTSHMGTSAEPPGFLFDED